LKNAKIGDDELKPVEAIIRSMTKEERRKPEIINGSRRQRIATGSGRSIAEVNRLVKQFGEMQKMMKRMGGMTTGKKGKRKMSSMAGLGGLGAAGLPGQGGGFGDGLGGGAPGGGFPGFPPSR
jgi:signal recognition particle subunit SRP54